VSSAGAILQMHPGQSSGCLSKSKEEAIDLGLLMMNISPHWRGGLFGSLQSLPISRQELHEQQSVLLGHELRKIDWLTAY
jgi:hypothetical protein